MEQIWCIPMNHATASTTIETCPKRPPDPRSGDGVTPK